MSKQILFLMGWTVDGECLELIVAIASGTGYMEYAVYKVQKANRSGNW